MVGMFLTAAKSRMRCSVVALMIVVVATATMSSNLLESAEAFPLDLAPDIMLKAGLKPSEIEIIDINYDSLPDLVTVNDDGDDISFFLQKTDRTFNPTPDFNLSTGDTPVSAGIDDLNRDDLLDIVVFDAACLPGPASCNLSFFYQRPDFSYPAVPNQVVQRWDIVPWELAVADYNSDGMPDVAVSNQADAGTFIFLQLVGGGFPDAPDWILPKSPGMSFGITGTDLNSDGLDDIALANYQSQSVSIYYQRTDHTLPLLPDLNLSSGNGPIHITPGDIDGDGLTDLVVTNGEEHTFSIFHQRTNYTLPKTPDMKVNIGGSGFGFPFHSALGDVNNDGRTDIVVTRTSRDVASVFVQLPSGGYPSIPSFNLSAEGSREAAIGDIDGDGLDDIALSIYLDNFLENVFIYYQEPTDIPPVTSLTVGNPQIGGALPLVTSSTPLSFQAIDGSGTGIASTLYRINSGSWGTYVRGTTFNLPAEGINTIEFYSVDNSSNVESVRTEQLGVDDTSPETSISIGNPHFQSSNLWISPATAISLAAIDRPSPSAGVNFTTYRIWSPSSWSPWLAYAGPFNLTEEGTCIIQFLSEDHLGNTEIARDLSVIVDESPPMSFAEAPFVVNGSRALSLTAIDAGVGVSSTHISVDGGPWSIHGSVVYLRGDADHQVRYYSDDLLGNVELEKIISLPRSTPGPLTSLETGSPNHGNLPVFVTSATPLSLLAQDLSGTGINVTMYRVDGGLWRNYAAPFQLISEGAHEVSYFSVDNISQPGTIETSFLVVDDSGPEAALFDGGGKHFIRGGARFATSSSSFAIDAEDQGILPVGIDGMTYRAWTSSGWSDWNPYSTPFSLGLPEGARWIQFYATDLLANAGAVMNSTVVVDDDPPATSISPGDSRALIGTYFALSSDDGQGSGVAALEYRIDGGSWAPYSIPFTIVEGWHNITYRSRDNLNNSIEKTHTVEIFSPEVPPDGEVAVNYKPIVALVFAIILLMAGVWSSKRRPWKGGKDRMAVMKVFTFTSMPFVVAEAATGIASLLTGQLSMPPVVGVGTAIDLAILLAGTVFAILQIVRTEPSEVEKTSASQNR